VKHDPNSKFLQYLMALSLSLPAVSMAAPTQAPDALRLSSGAAAQVENLATQAQDMARAQGGEADPALIGWPWPKLWPRAWGDVWPQVTWLQDGEPQAQNEQSLIDLLDEVRRA
jgi:hypothetical protein